MANIQNLEDLGLMVIENMEKDYLEKRKRVKEKDRIHLEGIIINGKNEAYIGDSKLIEYLIKNKVQFIRMWVKKGEEKQTDQRKGVLAVFKAEDIIDLYNAYKKNNKVV